MLYTYMPSPPSVFLRNSGAIARSSTGAFAFSAVLGAVALLGLLCLGADGGAPPCWDRAGHHVLLEKSVFRFE